MSAAHVERPLPAHSPIARRRVALQVLSGEYAGAEAPRVFPIEPLARQVELLGGFRGAATELVGRRRERIERAWWRGVEAGYVTWKEADSLAVELLGVHPFAVWGDAWFGPA